jgi:uncharacterized membrane protein
MVSLILAAGGVLNAAYLTITKLTNTQTACIEGGAWNCDGVQSSIYSSIAGIPVQYIGLAWFLAIFLVLMLEPRLPFFAARGKYLVFGMTLFGFLFSAYLTSIEAFVLEQWCVWCVVSAVIMTLLFIVAGVRLWQSMNALPEEQES